MFLGYCRIHIWMCPTKIMEVSGLLLSYFIIIFLLLTLVVLINFVWISGDLFIDGKVIPRKKYRRPPQNNNPEEQDDKGNEKRRPSQSQRSNRNRSKRE